MIELSTTLGANTRNATQASLRSVAQALASTSLEVLAEAIGKDDSTVSRVRSEEAKVSMSDAVRLLCAAGLKVVGADRVCVERASYEAMVTIAAKAMSCSETVRRLTWDDER
ncbi:MAG: hypothetical protein ACRCV9_04060 [Burkholderiaceae bacterium]